MSFFAVLKRIFTHEQFIEIEIAHRVEEVTAYLAANYHPKPAPKPSAPVPPKEPIKPKEERKNEVRYSISVTIPSTPEAMAEVGRRLDMLMGAENSQKILQSVHQAKMQTFVDCLRHHIYRQGLTGPQVYRAAQIDKRLYSKIISNTHHKPSRETAIALAFAARLTLDQAKTLLSRAGYTLSEANRRDLILTYFFQNNSRNLIEINGVLDALGEAPIGRG